MVNQLHAVTIIPDFIFLGKPMAAKFFQEENTFKNLS